MARKTRTCTFSKVEEVLGQWVMRKCILTRNHSGKCWDDRGAFG